MFRYNYTTQIWKIIILADTVHNVKTLIIITIDRIGRIYFYLCSRRPNYVVCSSSVQSIYVNILK